MERRQFLAVTTVGVASTIAGCAGGPLSTGSAQGGDPENDTESDESETVTIENESTIEVSARGEVQTDPDEATASVGVEVSGETAEDVTGELAERSETLREAFDELGIPDENVESGRYDVREDRNAAGYVGRHAFQVTIEDVDRVGEVIDAAVDAGANDVGRVHFGLSDETRAEMRDDALDHALANADAEAEHVADNRGVEIAATRSVSTRNVDVVPVDYDANGGLAAEGGDDAAPATDFETGPVSVTAAVEVVYAVD